ncbi:10278_t:CDS:2 [Funneliformis geosporum]|uniref:17258_t:CDS:1 n=1 Tax=Funneliformis geosporum TaxID=1117311 RepID=A0A9W4WK61_9GLOM|nr:17258_t:CDS:2 [Funneliformis geosporum]CAI2169103.1 10278_t:CDS:2 [Funneliformis geosporum]
MVKFIIPCLIILLVGSLRNVVHAQDQTCSINNNEACVKLNEILLPCGGTFGPPPTDNIQSQAPFEYNVAEERLAICMCNEDAYNTLSTCLLCFGNKNIKATKFTHYQKTCRDFGISFGPPIDKSSASTAKHIIIGVLVSISLILLGGLLFWYWYTKRSKRSRRKKKNSSENENTIENNSSTQQIMIHHPSPGSETIISATSYDDDNQQMPNGGLQPKYEPGAYYTSSSPLPHTGLFPPPGTIQQQQYYPSNVPPRPQYLPARPYYNNTTPPPPASSQQNYLPPQQPFLPPQQIYRPTPPPTRPHPRPPHFDYNHDRATSPNYHQRVPTPPRNYYNNDNYYGR